MGSGKWIPHTRADHTGTLEGGAAVLAGPGVRDGLNADPRGEHECSHIPCSPPEPSRERLEAGPIPDEPDEPIGDASKFAPNSPIKGEEGPSGAVQREAWPVACVCSAGRSHWTSDR